MDRSELNDLKTTFQELLNLAQTIVDNESKIDNCISMMNESIVVNEENKQLLKGWIASYNRNINSAKEKYNLLLETLKIL